MKAESQRSIISGISSRSRSSRAAASPPKTTVRIDSKEIASISSWSRSSCPGRQRAILRSAISSHPDGELAPVPGAERRQQDLPLAHVLVAVEEQDRVRPDDGAEEPVRVPGAEYARVAGDHLLGGLRLGDHHHVRRAEAHREDLAVALAATVHQLDRPEHPAQGLRRARPPGARRQSSFPNIRRGHSDPLLRRSSKGKLRTRDDATRRAGALQCGFQAVDECWTPPLPFDVGPPIPTWEVRSSTIHFAGGAPRPGSNPRQRSEQTWPQRPRA